MPISSLKILICKNYNRSVLVLFGSQTGNSENIAQDINAKLLRENISSRCLCLNDVANNLLKKELRALIIGSFDFIFLFCNN